jgi:hypothetical protein
MAWRSPTVLLAWPIRKVKILQPMRALPVQSSAYSSSTSFPGLRKRNHTHRSSINRQLLRSAAGRCQNWRRTSRRNPNRDDSRPFERESRFPRSSDTALLLQAFGKRRIHLRLLLYAFDELAAVDSEKVSYRSAVACPCPTIRWSSLQHPGQGAAGTTGWEVIELDVNRVSVLLIER